MATKLSSTAVVAGQDATAAQYNAVRADVVNLAGDYATTGGSANAYTLTIDAAFVLAAGVRIKAKASFAGTGSCTMNVNGGGAVTMKWNGGDTLVSGESPSGAILDLIYDGTDWIMQTARPVRRKSGVVNDNGGSSQTIAHGLGMVPKYVRFYSSIKGVGNPSNSGHDPESIGFFDGTNYATKYVAWSGINSTSITHGTSTSEVVHIDQGGNSGGSLYATITVDATNINITWSVGGTRPGTVKMLWEVEG